MSVYMCYLLLAGIQIPLFSRKSLTGRRSFDAKNYLMLCCVELIFLAGIRGYTIGADTAMYLRAIEYYERFPVLELISAKLVYPFDFEVGYFVLTKFSVLLGLGKTGFLFLIAIIIYIPVFLTIKKHSSMPYISVLCYFAFGMFTYSLGLFRQMIAISILFLGWRYVVERHFVKYMMVVGIAMLFHTTALVAIPLYILYGIGWKKIIWFLPLLEVILLLFGRPIVLSIVQLFPKYAGYVGSRYDLQGGSYLMLILLNLLLVVCVLTITKKNNRDEDITICALILAICLQSIGYSMAIFGRIVPYFSSYIMFAVPNIINNLGNRWRVVGTLIAFIFLFVLIYLQFYGNKYVVPYYTVFNKLYS